MEPISYTRRRWGNRCIALLIILAVLTGFDIIRFEKSPKHQTLQQVIAKRQNITDLLIDSIPRQQEYGRVNIEYVKPVESQCGGSGQRARITDSANNCWVECFTEYKNVCKKGSLTLQELSIFFDKNYRKVYCAPRVIIAGMPRCGTNDLHQWLNSTTDTVRFKADFHMTHGTCVTDQIKATWTQLYRGDHKMEGKALIDYTLYNTQADLLVQTYNLGLSLKTKTKNRTLRVRSIMLHLQELTVPETRYVVMLRDPVSRVMSQLQEWSDKGSVLERKLDRHYIHDIVMDQIRRLNKCFREYGPTACIYLTNSKPDNLDTLLLWGMYVEYLQEALKFIDKNQLQVLRLEDYGNKEREHMLNVVSFANIELSIKADTLDMETNIVNPRSGSVKPLRLTLDLLREFYKPFNIRLARLLKDKKKWCYTSC